MLNYKEFPKASIKDKDSKLKLRWVAVGFLSLFWNQENTTASEKQVKAAKDHLMRL